MYLVMQSPMDSKDVVLGRQYMHYNPPPLGAFCLVEERIVAQRTTTKSWVDGAT